MSRPHRSALARDLRTALVAALTAGVVALVAGATPSIAAKVRNADKVDGKHAVAAKASPAKRAGKLVATDRTGHLPSDIVVPGRALDADRLDGLDSAELARTTSARGSVQTGYWSAWGGGAGTYVGDTVTLPSALTAAIPPSRVTMVPAAGAPTAECPGVGRVAVAGWACFYEKASDQVTLASPVFDPGSNGGSVAGVATHGFGMVFECSATKCYSYGTWSVSAP